MKICPECGGTEFSIAVVEYHSWKVDGDGNFLEDLGCNDIGSKSREFDCMSCLAFPVTPVEKEPK